MISYDEFPSNSRVWIYQSTSRLNEEQSMSVQIKLHQFANDWVSHNTNLKAKATLYHGRFIVLMVDENRAGASGCSIDKSVNFIQNLGKAYGVDFFDRMNFAYRKGDEIVSVNKEEFEELYKMGFIDDDTIVFNNLVSTKEDLEQAWEVKLGESWHKRMVA